MRLNQDALSADTLVYGCGQFEAPHNGESDAVTHKGSLIAYRRHGYPGTPLSRDWDWVHKDFRK